MNYIKHAKNCIKLDVNRASKAAFSWFIICNTDILYGELFVLHSHTYNSNRSYCSIFNRILLHLQSTTDNLAKSASWFNHKLQCLLWLPLTFKNGLSSDKLRSLFDTVCSWPLIVSLWLREDSKLDKSIADIFSPTCDSKLLLLLSRATAGETVRLIQFG